ncbi:SMC5-like protein [Naviculisporaceae sp. PSN 640]
MTRQFARYPFPDRENTPNTDLAPPPSGHDEFEGLGLRGGDGSRRYHDSDDDDDEDQASSGEDDDHSRSRSGRRAHTTRATNGLRKDEFQPGAIVRVKLQNFVTYEKAEFFLGPNLNMVIGPNGTGKSSLVCAICLGLGYPSHVLGRASGYGEYVKHGKDEADIEVELQRKSGEARNYVVGLTIRREDNSRKFTLNGQRATHKDIQQLMKTLRIQIDNLCQFLPQDKVAEFAGLGPVELLEKTLQAAAPEEMIQWQKELKEYFKTQKEAQVSAQESSQELEKMEGRQRVLQADVEKLRERKEIQENMETLEKVKLIVRYNEARREYAGIKKAKKEAVENLKRLQQSCAPSLEAVNRKQDYRDIVQAAVNHRRSRLRAAEAAADQAADAIEAIEAKYVDAGMKADAERTNLDAKRRDIATQRKKLTDLEAKHNQAPKPFDAADWNRRIREKEHVMREKTKEIGDAGEAVDLAHTQGITNRRKLKKIQTDLENLNSQQGQLLAHLRKIDLHAAQGWEWLQANQDQFEKEVFGPPMLNCSIKDPRYSDLVQSLLSSGDFLCFTTQTRADHKKLSDQFYSKLKLQVSIRSCFVGLDSFKPPLPASDLNQLGLDGYVKDYLEGPEPVLAMLCSSHNIHQSAVALKDLSDEQYTRLLDGGSINAFAAGKSVYGISRRREYGPGAVSTKTTTLPKGRFWTDQPVDTAEKAALMRQRNEAKDDDEEYQRVFREKKAQKKKLEDELEVLEKDLEDIRKQKNELQREYNEWRTLPDKIDLMKRNIAQKKAALDEAKARIGEYALEQDKIVLEKAKAVLEHQKRVTSIRDAYQAFLEASLILIEASSDVEALKTKNAEIVQRLDQEKKNVDELERKRVASHEFATAARAEIQGFLDGGDLPVELSDMAKSRTSEDVEQELSAEKAKLDVIQASNPMALEEFERWAAKIERERANHANQEKRLEELNRKIETIRGQWEPRLDELVGQINDAFSYNFEQISCAGEVGVHKDEDFDKWAIEIKVKFRENETLQRLDQHRQSGGERAVSTIFYLMSLQSMAQAPFRVVDEINQGMDPRNERMVHERMVEIACREHTSQYFLITPKLLSGLRYDERMRVHTIVSGEFVDEEGTEKMNFGRFVKIRKALRDR